MSRDSRRREWIRLRLAGGVLLALFPLLAARAVQLTLIEQRGVEMGSAQTGTVVTLAPARGGIFDRNGAELAVAMPAPSVYAVPREVADPAAAAQALAPVLGRDAARLEARLSQDSPFVFLARWAGEERAQAVRQLALPGVGVVQEPGRSYPLGSLAGRLLGFANVDGVGVRGIEQAEDAWLRGAAQRVALERDARGRLLADAGVDPRSAAGGDVALTLDATLQADVEHALEETLRETGARGGLALVMDPRSGDLLALAEAPAVNPGNFRRTAYGETRSPAFLDAFEPGSVLKPLVVAAALERGVLGERELIDCEQGAWEIPGKRLQDMKPNGLLDAAGILRVSSNVGVAKIALRLSPGEHNAALRAFGLGRATGSGFPDESAGLLRAAARWQPLDQATIAFGQGVNVTALQLAAAGGVFANGGVLRTPRLLSARRRPDGDGSWRAEPAGPARRVLRPEVAGAVLQMLESVVSEGGTGLRASLEGVRVAGKTGTAQKFDRRLGRYADTRLLGWFLGIAPVEAPRMVGVVMLDEPRGRKRGGSATAAPLFAQVAEAALAREGLVAAPRFGLPQLARAGSAPPAHLARHNSGGNESGASSANGADSARKAAGANGATKARSAKTRSTRAKAARTAQNAQPAAQRQTARGADATDAAGANSARAKAPVPVVARLGDRVLLPDLRGLTREQVQRLARGEALAVDLQGRGRVVAQHPAPGTIFRPGQARLTVQLAPGRRGG